MQPREGLILFHWPVWFVAYRMTGEVPAVLTGDDLETKYAGILSEEERGKKCLLLYRERMRADEWATAARFPCHQSLPLNDSVEACAFLRFAIGRGFTHLAFDRAAEAREFEAHPIYEVIHDLESRLGSVPGEDPNRN